MEATIKQNNISANVSINIATLMASVQGVLKAIKQRALKELSLPRLYRRQLRMINTLARVIEAHPIITDTMLWVLGGAIVIETFLSL